MVKKITRNTVTFKNGMKQRDIWVIHVFRIEKHKGKYILAFSGRKMRWKQLLGMR